LGRRLSEALGALSPKGALASHLQTDDDPERQRPVTDAAEALFLSTSSSGR